MELLLDLWEGKRSCERPPDLLAEKWPHCHCRTVDVVQICERRSGQSVSLETETDCGQCGYDCDSGLTIASEWTERRRILNGTLVIEIVRGRVVEEILKIASDRSLPIAADRRPTWVACSRTSVQGLRQTVYRLLLREKAIAALPAEA